ncbi:hypothetical protein BLNAU_17937 [Blattamonas nauphoetae]|uniref:HECT-type E3 ubiquitin transferase n=1 Tax=Blattamonas nauphoetae TaxID=2049346 RepID=A0ABQ9X5X1_9EUKA|nr:hypothetical protein BLNAU_17937 [Blattamonas nauphoetae]
MSLFDCKSPIRNDDHAQYILLQGMFNLPSIELQGKKIKALSSIIHSQNAKLYETTVNDATGYMMWYGYGVETEQFENWAREKRLTESLGSTGSVVQYDPWVEDPESRELIAIMKVNPKDNLFFQMIEWKKQNRELFLLLIQLILPLSSIHKSCYHRAIRPQFIFLSEDRPARYIGFMKAVEFEKNEDLTKVVKEEYPCGVDGIRPLESYPSEKGPLEYDGRVDVFAIGLILHEIAYGRSVFPENARDSQKAHLICKNQLAIKKDDQERSRFNRLLTKMLSVSSEDRPTVTQLLSDSRLTTARAYLESTPKIQLVKIEKLSLIQAGLPTETIDGKLEERVRQFEKQLDTIRKKDKTIPIILDRNDVLHSACDAFFVLPPEDLHHPISVTFTNSPSPSSFPELVQLIFHELTENPEFCIFKKDSTTGYFTITPDNSKRKLEFIRYFRLTGMLIACCLLQKVKIPVRFNDFIWRQLSGRSLHPVDLEHANSALFRDINSVTRESLKTSPRKFEVALPDDPSHALFPGGSEMEVTPDRIDVYKEQAIWCLLIDIPPIDNFCLKEPLEKGDPFYAKLTVFSPSKAKFDYTFLAPTREVIQTQDSTNATTIKYKATQDGDYVLCLQQQFLEKGGAERKPIQVNVTVYTGQIALLADINASTSLNITDNIKSLELQVKDILSSISTINQRETETTSKNSQSRIEAQALSITSIVVVVIVSIAEMFYLRKFFRQQKVA